MTLLILILLAPLVVLTLSFTVEILCGLKPLGKPARSSEVHIQTVIIVPAHDEQAVIEPSLRRLEVAAADHARVLLVADNCTDATASIGRALGVEVIERSDAVRKGKGFALDFARNHLASDPPEIVVIVDADCSTDRQSVEALIRSCAATDRPCQATYLQRPSPLASPVVQLSTFAFYIKNVVRERALQRLAGRAHLVGSGMAFPWTVFSSAQLATSNIVEDLRLGQELADAGHPPIFVEQAVVWSNAETDANTMSQRQRWEGGFLQNALHAGPPMFLRALKSGDARLFWAAIDTVIPPFALLILFDIAALCVAAAVTWLSSSALWPTLSLASTLSVALLALASAWGSGGSRFVTLRSLARAPLYLAWKLPMYIGLGRRGAPKEWVRTGR